MKSMPIKDYALTLLMLVVGLMATGLTWFVMDKQIHHTEQLRFDRYSERTIATIQERLINHERLLEAGRGLFYASKSVEFDAWRAFVGAQNLEHYPGVLGLGYILPVQRAQLPSFVAAMRKQVPEFAVRSKGDSPDLYVVTQIEPAARNRAAWGFDIGQEAHRRAAAELAVATGKPTLTKRITLVQDQKKIAGFLMLLPIYQTKMLPPDLAARKQALLGWIYVPIRIEELMSGIVGATENMLDFEILEGDSTSKQDLIFDADGHVAENTDTHIREQAFSARLFHKKTRLETQGQIWTIYTSTRPEFEQTAAQAGWVLPIGLLLSLMAALAMWSMTYARRRALALASHMTKDLQDFKIAEDWHSIISIANVQGNIIEVNSKFSEISGYSKEELLGKNHRIVKSGYHPQAFYEEIWSDIASGKVWHGQIKNRRKDGSFYWVYATITPILDEFGVPEKYISVRTDITQIKELETEHERVQDEILRLNASLEERVQQRTVELEEKNSLLAGQQEELQSQQEELRQSNEELEEKNQLLAEQKVEVEYKNREIEASKLKLQERAEQLALTSKYKSEFLSNMSHELRTPLNSLLILAQMLAENPEHNLSEQQIEYAKIIQGAGKDLLELINDILDLSKIESGTVTLDLQDVSFTNVHEQLERTFRHVAASRGLGFSVELAPNLPESLHTDSQRLQQVLKNLLSNAFKFTQQGQVSVRIAAVESGWSVDHDGLNRAGAVIGFFVTDTGIGLQADKQKIIFEAFQQADTGTTRKYGGTGLGLSISRELAWLLGGELHLVESELGKGSTFVLYLPLRAPESGQGTPKTTQSTPAAAARVQETNPQPAAIADDRAAIKPGEHTLLIIEDDARFAGILLRAGRDKGFKGIVAMRGDDGLKLADEFKPTAITLDLHLPDMDGWVVLERLKRNPDTRHIPVEIISAEDSRPRGLRSGAFKYLVKPVTVESLQKALTDVNKFTEREMKDLLVVDGDEQHRNTVLDLIGNGNVHTKAVASGKDALAALKKKRYDCIVLDINLPDIPDLLEAIQGLALTCDVPVIVYGMDELPKKEQERLKSLVLKGIVKEVRSPARLLDETALFLHRVVSKLPEERRQMLEKLYLSADSLAGKKVLVVDDDMRNIFALTAVLERHKMVVLSAENGRDALEALGNNPDVDIVLMDIMMPEMDGYEAMRQIRQMKQFETLPIIALTAKAMQGDREQCIAAGASDYISKPVDTDQLVSLLRVWLYR